MASDTVEVREATQADAAGISGLLGDAFREFDQLYTAAAFAATALPESAVLARVEQGPVWVAERGRVLVGTVAAVRREDSVLLRGMAVLPHARGLGVGRALLACTERFAASLAVGRLTLYTTGFLHEAIRLYEGAGLQFTGKTTDLHGVELLEMSKKVP